MIFSMISRATCRNFQSEFQSEAKFTKGWCADKLQQFIHQCTRKQILDVGSRKDANLQLSNSWIICLFASSSSKALRTATSVSNSNFFFAACCEASESRPIKCSHHLAPWRSQCCSLICRRPAKVPLYEIGTKSMENPSGNLPYLHFNKTHGCRPWRRPPFHSRSCRSRKLTTSACNEKSVFGAANPRNPTVVLQLP